MVVGGGGGRVTRTDFGMGGPVPPPIGGGQGSDGGRIGA